LNEAQFNLLPKLLNETRRLIVQFPAILQTKR